MKMNNQDLIDGLKHSIKLIDERIERTKEPCSARYRHLKSAERDLLRKKRRELVKRSEEAEDEYAEID